MAERLFDAEGRLSINDRGLTAGLKKAEAKVRETVARIDGQEATVDIKAEDRELSRKIKEAEAKVAKFRQAKAEAELDVDKSEFDRKLTMAERRLASLNRKRAKVRLELDQRSGLVSKTIEGVLKYLGRVGPAADDADGGLRRLSKTMSDTRVTVGPLSMTLGRLLIAAGALAPVVSGLAGTAGGLAGVLGHGLVGSLGLAGSALIGFGGIAGGVFAAIKGNSDVFEGVSKAAKELASQFAKLTRGGAKDFAKDLRTSLGSLKGLIPDLAAQTNAAMKTLGGAAKDFTSMLGQGEGKSNLLKILDNANQALKPLTAGFTTLSQVGLRVFGSFSRYLPKMGEGFQGWAERLLTATDNGKKLDGTVDELMKSLSSVGKLATSGGRLLLNFFAASAPAGRRMLGDITNLFNKWSEWLQDDGNRQKLTDFLDDSWNTTKKVAGVIGDMIRGFHTLSEAARPTVDALLDLSKGMADLVGYLGKIPGFGPLLQGLVGAAVVARMAKLAGYLARIVGLTGALKGAKGVLGKLFGKDGVGPEDAPVVIGKGGKGDPAKEARTWRQRFMAGLKGGWETIALGTLIGLDKLKGAASKAGTAAKGALGRAMTAGRVRLAWAATYFDDVVSAAKRAGPRALSALGTALRSPVGKGGVLMAVGEGLSQIMDRLIPKLPGGKDGLVGRIFGQMNAQAPWRVLQSSITTLLNPLDSVKSRVEGVKRAFGTLKGAAATALGGVGSILGKVGGGAKTVAIKFAVTGMSVAKSAIGLAGKMAGKAVRYAIRFAVTAYGAARSAVSFGARMAGKAVRFAVNFAVRAVSAARSAYGFGRRMAGKAVRFAIGFAVRALSAAKSAYQFGKSMVGKAISFSINFAVSGLNAARSAFNWAKSKVGGSIGMTIPGKATGGTPLDAGTPAREKDIERATARVPMGPQGGRVNSARYVVGEEPGTEFVIPMNPAYRSRAKNLARMAVTMLGGNIEGFKKGKKGKPMAHVTPDYEDRDRANDRLFATAGDITSGISKKKKSLEGEERKYDQAERKYSIQSPNHEVLNEDGTRNESSIEWHKAQINELIRMKDDIIRQYQDLMKMVRATIKDVKRGLSDLMDWNPRSSFGRSRKKSLLSGYNEALGTLTEDMQDIPLKIGDLRLDKMELQQNRDVIDRTKATDQSSSGGGTGNPDGTSNPTFTEQLGSYNTARNDLLSAFGGNAIGNLSSLMGAVGSVGSGSFAGAAFKAAMGASSGGIAGANAAANIAAMGGAPTGAIGGASGTMPGPDAGARTVQQYITIEEPPEDAHTFTKKLAWEAQNAV